MSARATPQLIVLQDATAGRYSVERELGRGGMAIVYLARDAALDRPVAIKLLPPHLGGIPDMRARFVHEARTAARLSHPNIVPIHSVEEHGEIVFFVMSFVAGETLAARVRRAGPVGWREGGRIFQELAWALAYAHSAGVIHRDVKPENVLLERATGRALLTDFGIARVAGSEPLTKTGEVLGTVQFMSPEQVSGGAVDGRSDLYSLGVTVFVALTGRVPFEGPTPAAVVGMHLTRPAPPIASMREGLPPRLAGAIDQCLAKDPGDRFSTGEQLAEAIAEARVGIVETPPAIRAFLRDRARAEYDAGIFFFGFLYLVLVADVPPSTIAGAFALVGVLSVGLLLHNARRVLRSGFSFEDVRAAVLADAAARDEEWAGVRTPPRERAAQRRRSGYLLMGSAALLGMGVAVAREAIARGQDLAGVVGFAVLAGTAVLMALQAVKKAGGASPSVDLLGHHRVARLWSGRFGRWFFRVAGIRLHQPEATPVEGETHTETLITRAAGDLLSALPPGLEARLPEARRVIQRLQSQVTLLRQREAKLASAMAQVGDVAHPDPPGDPPAAADVASSLLARRRSLMEDLKDARRDAAAKRASAIAALENIRLQLLRLHAGVAGPQDLEADLQAAAGLAREMGTAATRSGNLE